MINILLKRPFILPRRLLSLNEMFLSLRIYGYRESERKKDDSGKSMMCLSFVYFKGKNAKKIFQLNFFFSDLL